MSDDVKPSRRKPAAFNIEDPAVVVEETPLEDKEVEMEAEELQQVVKPKATDSWWTLFISAVGGLVVLSFMLWLTSFVTSLLYREDWIGWLSLILLALASLAGFMLIAREIIGLARLKRQGELKRNAELAIEDKSLSQSKLVLTGIEELLRDREELRWGFSRLREQGRDVLDADQLLILAEREVLSELDKQAQNLIAVSARRVALITTLSPTAFIDVAFVAYENMRLLRSIAMLYGARPGVYGLIRLGKMVLGHLTLTGGLALSADMLQQFMGQRIAAKISAKLGEGLFNGTLTARIGLAALDICRPLPYLKARKPAIRDLISTLVSGIAK